MTEKIELKDLLAEIKVALSDEFVAEVKTEGDDLTLRFVNGQTFRLQVKEV